MNYVSKSYATKSIIISLIVIFFIVPSAGCINSEDKELDVSVKYLLGELTIYNEGNFTWKNAEIEINEGYYFTINELEADKNMVIEVFRFRTEDGESFNYIYDSPNTVTVRISGWEDLEMKLSSPLETPSPSQSQNIFEGNIEDLLLSNYEIPLRYRDSAERTSMPASEIFPDEDLPDDLGFEEAYALTAMYFDEDYNFGIIAQLVMRLDIDEMEKAMDEYEDAQIEEYEDGWAYVDFGNIGDETFGLKFTDDDLGTDAYELVFTKDDIMVVFIVAGEENTKSFIEELAETVEDKI